MRAQRHPAESGRVAVTSFRSLRARLLSDLRHCPQVTATNTFLRHSSQQALLWFLLN